jgi:hypothetical protein
MLSYPPIKAARFPFAIPAISNYQVLVASPAHIQELPQAPEDNISFRKAMNKGTPPPFPNSTCPNP